MTNQSKITFNNFWKKMVTTHKSLLFVWGKTHVIELWAELAFCSVLHRTPLLLKWMIMYAYSDLDFVIIF